ncbi:hypothetical protein LY78DRAFT_74917 [Colletotrichum sublineola]|nr:hypothetical protein LY78DRAFT_74917 [Colletotrichum sublineola]
MTRALLGRLSARNLMGLMGKGYRRGRNGRGRCPMTGSSSDRAAEFHGMHSCSQRLNRTGRTEETTSGQVNKRELWGRPTISRRSTPFAKTSRVKKQENIEATVSQPKPKTRHANGYLEPARAGDAETLALGAHLSLPPTFKLKSSQLNHHRYTERHPARCQERHGHATEM